MFRDRGMLSEKIFGKNYYYYYYYYLCTTVIKSRSHERLIILPSEIMCYNDGRY